MFVIAFSGKQRSGKDTIATVLSKRLHIPVVACADEIKRTFLHQHPELTLEQLEQNKAEYRPELIRIGEDGRMFRKEHWLENVLIHAQRDLKHSIVIVSDLRLRAEYEFLKTYYPCLLIRLVVEDDIRRTRGVLSCENDPTETELDQSDLFWDLRLDNSCQERIYKNVETIIERLEMVLVKKR